MAVGNPGVKNKHWLDKLLTNTCYVRRELWHDDNNTQLLRSGCNCGKGWGDLTQLSGKRSSGSYLNTGGLGSFGPCSFETRVSHCFTFDSLLLLCLISFLLKIPLITSLVQWNECNSVCVVHLVISVLSLLFPVYNAAGKNAQFHSVKPLMNQGPRQKQRTLEKIVRHGKSLAVNLCGNSARHQLGDFPSS